MIDYFDFETQQEGQISADDLIGATIVRVVEGKEQTAGMPTTITIRLKDGREFDVEGAPDVLAMALFYGSDA